MLRAMREKDTITYFSDKRKDIEDLVQRWLRRFPEEYQDNLMWVRVAREEYKQEKYQDRPLRKGLLVHPRLLLYIQQFHPTFMDSNEDVRWFSKKFPVFVVDNGVLPV